MGQSPGIRVRVLDLAALYHLIIILSLLGALGAVVANVACFDGLREARPDSETPLVSILVPARNEALNIGPCLRSLLAQDHPYCELIMLDDSSQDATAEIARGLGLSENGTVARLIRGTPLPEGWVGKNWACHQLAQQARGEFLFFTDADTEHATGTVTALLAYAKRRRADLISAWPRLVTVTWGEQLILPMITLLGMVIYPHWLLLLLQRFPKTARLVPRRWLRLLGAANGQSLFFRRAAYNQIGGHEALRDHIVEDVALGRAVAAHMGEGLRLFNCDALRFSSCRMYRSFWEVWEGFTKNLRAVFENSLAGFLYTAITQSLCFLAPCVLLFLVSHHRKQIVIEVALIYLIRIILTVRFRTSWLSCVFHPIGHALALAIGLNSWLKMASGGGVTWKGRKYSRSTGM